MTITYLSKSEETLNMNKLFALLVSDGTFWKKVNDISYQEAFSQGQQAYHRVHFANLESLNSR